MLAALLLVSVAGLANLDLLTGQAVPFYRDIGTTQWPARELFKTLGPSAINPYAPFGQPYFGNPNLVLAYPAPKDPKFLGLHLLVHVGLGILGAYVFFRRVVRTRDGAFFGAAAYGLSGYVLSSTAFLNATTTLAWLPWLLVAAALARGAVGRKALLPLCLGTAAAALLILGGEPALGGLGGVFAILFAAARPGPMRARLRAASVVLASGLLASLATSPWLLEVWRATEGSSRRVRGFSWAEFSAVSFHPWRLLETPFPSLFGDPSRLLSGGFWGYTVTNGNPPYIASMSFGVLPLALALVFASSARRMEGRFFLVMGATAFALSVVQWIPGARAVYEWARPLHAFRYPGKAAVVVTLCVAALSAMAFDRILVTQALPRFRNRTFWVLLVLAGLLGIGAVWGREKPDLVEAALRRFWEPTAHADPRVVLAPIVGRVPPQAAGAALLLLLLALTLKRGLDDALGRAVLLCALVCEQLLSARFLLPRVPSELLKTRFPLVEAARRIGGRVFEDSSKELYAVRDDLHGRYAANNLTSLVTAQLSQGWAMTGSRSGLRYAYDRDPDGSYTFLNRIATDVVRGRDWPVRLKWLRAAGVRAVIASNLPRELIGPSTVLPVLVEAAAGLPVALFQIQRPIPGVRRASRVFVADSINETVRRFEDDRFDPASDVVLAGNAAALGEWSRAIDLDPAAVAQVLRETPDALLVETAGAAPGILFVDRSYTSRAKALVNGRPTAPVPANLHLIGIPVPSGTSRVELDLAP